jgi:hypothetical protein
MNNTDTPGNVLAAQTAYEDLGPTRPLTSSAPRVPPKIARIVGELGLRYRPSAQADLEAHAATLALLSRDLADVDPAKLEMAANHWARTERFMPRAAELRSLVSKFSDKAKAAEMAVERGNAMLEAEGLTDRRWVLRDGRCVIEWAVPPEGSAA